MEKLFGKGYLPLLQENLMPDPAEHLPHSQPGGSSPTRPELREDVDSPGPSVGTLRDPATMLTLLPEEDPENPEDPQYPGNPEDPEGESAEEEKAGPSRPASCRDGEEAGPGRTLAPSSPSLSSPSPPSPQAQERAPQRPPRRQRDTVIVVGEDPPYRRTAHQEESTRSSPTSTLQSTTEPTAPLTGRMGAREAGRSEWIKVVFILVSLTVAGLSNWAVLAYTHDITSWEPLPDIVFNLIPEQDWAARVGDAFVSLCIAFLAVLVVFHKYRVIVMRRVGFIAATLYAMRSVTLAVTQLPPGYSNNHDRCRYQLPSFNLSTFFSRWAEQTIHVGFQQGQGMLCGDMLFSGHSLVMMVTSLTVAHYLPQRWKLFALPPTLFAYLGMACMVISRTHYTIDVVIAFWLTNFVFASYHAYAEVDLFMDRRQSVFSSIFYFRIIAWLEENIVPGRVDNVFVNPVRQAREWLESRRRCSKDGANNNEPSTDDSEAGVGGGGSGGGGGHHKQVSVSSSSTFALPS